MKGLYTPMLRYCCVLVELMKTTSQQSQRALAKGHRNGWYWETLYKYCIMYSEALWARKLQLPNSSSLLLPACRWASADKNLSKEIPGTFHFWKRTGLAGQVKRFWEREEIVSRNFMFLICNHCQINFIKWSPAWLGVECTIKFYSQACFSFTLTNPYRSAIHK